MRAQHFFNFERRDLVAAAFDDVDARSAKQSVRAVIEDRNIAGSEPAVDERLLRAFRPSPVFRKHARAS